MKLKTLKPRISTVSTSRIKSAPTATVERKRGSAGVRDRHAIRARDADLCQACINAGRLGVLGDAVDHKIPLWANGSDEPANKWLLCKPHHDRKSERETKMRMAGYYEPDPLLSGIDC